jgi:hypothetical protein
MQHRRVRLGDILDDYCPRERRITNHAVVAMIEDEVKRTRCTTCDAEHEYKQAKVPPPRQKKKPVVPAAVASEPVASEPVEPPALIASEPEEATEVENVLESVDSVEPAEPPVSEDTDIVSEAAAEPDDEWPVHRPLIRATLPRPEGQAPERKAPDFTIRQGGRFDGERNGNRARGKRSSRHGHGPSGGQSRFGSPQSRSGQGHGSRHGGQGQHHSGNPERHGNRQGPASGRPQGGRHGGGRGPKRGR